MKLDKWLEIHGKSKADVARILELSRAAVTKWDEIPEKWLGVLDGGWLVHKDRLYWQGSTFGHGSEWDYSYSAHKIFFIRQLLKDLGSVQAVSEWVSPVQFGSGFIQAVKDDVVCPMVTDMVEGRIKGGKAIPKLVYPFGDKS